MNSSTVSRHNSFRLVAILAAALPLAAQIPTAGQVSDAQAAAMIQALSAQAQTGAAPAMTQAQLQLLLQYMMRSGAASGANAMQAQAMMQMLAQSSAASPNAAISAMQAQSMAKMFASQQQSFQAPSPFGQPQMTTTAGALGPKKPGTIRIGVLTPQAQLAQNGSGANVTEPLRATIVRYLSGPMLEVTPIAALLPQQAEAEAKQKECDFVLSSRLTQKLNSGGLGMLKKAMPVASMIPMVGMAGMAGAAASAAAGTAMGGAASIASAVKAKSEVTFEYKLIIPQSGTAVAANSSTAKARTDGEDVITPLIEQADAAILATVTKK
ncbi:MAG: hypothetical protein LAO79_22305 [Acidobacteriia bacterium]|nr:hypothetical protein [Terriglobia bacterium]